MIEVPVYPNGYPCKCSGKCDYSRAFEDAGKPLFIDYESYVKKDFCPTSSEVCPTSAEERAIHRYLKTPYCLNK